MSQRRLSRAPARSEARTAAAEKAGRSSGLRLVVSQLTTAVALLADWRDRAGWLVGARSYDSGERAVEALTEGDDYRPP